MGIAGAARSIDRIAAMRIGQREGLSLFIELFMHPFPSRFESGECQAKPYF